MSYRVPRSEAALRELAACAWELYRRAERDASPHLVRPSMPILFFGDSWAYARSPVKVVTVGLNPSREEFSRASPFLRFPAAQHLARTPDPDLGAYLASLDSYFRTHPYRGWFDASYGPVLTGMGTSYYPGGAAVALHTDLCSPLATDPTWSRLGPQERRALEEGGQRLWHDLMDVLQPDVVLLSVRRQYLTRIAFPATKGPWVLWTVEGPDRRRPYVVEGTRRRLSSGKEPLFVFGQAAQTPFGTVSRAKKQGIGAAVRREAHHEGAALPSPHASRSSGK